MILTTPASYSLRFVRLITLILIALVIGVYIASLVAHYQMLQKVCTASREICQQTPTQLSPDDFASLQASGLSLSAYAALQVLKLLLYSSIWFGVGGLVLLRTPNQWMALVVAFTLITFPTQFDNLPDTLVRSYPALALPVQFLAYLIGLGLPLFLALFPNGRWSPPWVRWIVLLYVVTQYFVPVWLANTDWSAETVQIGQLALSLGLLGLLLAAQVIRYRRFSTPVERLQARWVVLGFATGFGIIAGLVVVWAIDVLPTTGWLAGFASQIIYQTAVVLIPISVAIAILRFHLFDIDIIIRRTLVYTILTALLGLVYFGGVTLLQSLFTSASGQASPAALVISTLLIAALFNPLRTRVQSLIDRRFYRQKYDSEKALAEFAAAARSETDLENLSSQLTGTVQEALQPKSFSLWLQAGGGKSK